MGMTDKREDADLPEWDTPGTPVDPAYTNLPALSEASILRLQPGDVVLLRATRNLSSEEIAQAKREWGEAMARAGHPDVELIIVTNAIGFDFQILRQA